VADANADGRINLADGVSLLSFLFTGGDPLPDLSPFESRICGAADEATFQRGMEIYMTAAARGNAFACSTCHSMMPPQDEQLRRPGHPLHDALRRPTYKNGALATFLEAANVCRVHWMITTPWTEEDTDFLDMVSFMNAISPREPAPALAFEIAPSAIAGPSAGDPARGCETFHGTCVVCHGEGAQGTILAPSLVFNPNAGLDPDYIRRRVRTSGNPDSVYGGLLTGGVMPFWSNGRLSVEELEDIVAWLTTRPVPDCVEDPVPTGEVVRRGTFMTRFHGVTGLIEELDSRQIRLREFSYDGQGIQVRVWLYRDGSIRDGYAIGPDLVRPFPGWENETL
ncbi:MAG: c-type cytochrome, partial [Actinobacteria bacterium]|nr:c-type cytochrome [Actinomycetota bacterium]